jgi:hypothetical protein
MVDLFLDDVRRALDAEPTTSREAAPDKGDRTRPVC